MTYYQGESDNSYWGSYLGVNEIISFWVDNNSCSPTESYYLPNTSITDGSQVYTEKYYSNSTNTAIWLFKVEGGGHDWPGVWGNMDIDASEEIWNFFAQYQPVVGCPGDFNFDGFVDTSDVLFMLSDFGCLANCLTDMTNDDITGTVDLLVFLSVFGFPCP